MCCYRYPQRAVDIRSVTRAEKVKVIEAGTMFCCGLVAFSHCHVVLYGFFISDL